MFTCMYVEWFKFKEKCSITTCKYHSSVLPTCCIALHHRQSVNKSFSDEELFYYKFNRSNNDLKTVGIKRKKALLNAKMILALYNYLQYLNTLSFQEKKKYLMPDNWEVSSTLNNFVNSLPLSLAKDKNLPFTINMLPYLFDNDIYTSYLAGIKGEAKNYTLSDILMQTASRFQNLCDELKMLQKQTGLFPVPHSTRNKFISHVSTTRRITHVEG